MLARNAIFHWFIASGHICQAPSRWLLRTRLLLLIIFIDFWLVSIRFPRAANICDLGWLFHFDTQMSARRFIYLRRHTIRAIFRWSIYYDYRPILPFLCHAIISAIFPHLNIYFRHRLHYISFLLCFYDYIIINISSAISLLVIYFTIHEKLSYKLPIAINYTCLF